MQLTDEQNENIEKLSGCSYSPENIAIYLGVDVDEFLTEWNTAKSDIRFHYDRGVLMVQADAEMKLVESAKNGNITAYQQVIKSQMFRSVENLKKKQQLDATISDVNSLQKFIDEGDSTGLTVKQKEQYEMMDMARKLYEGFQSKNYTLNCLMLSFPDKVKTRRHALAVYNEAINFFNANNDVKKEAWCHYYADKFEAAAEICREMNDMDGFYRNMKEARDSRLLGTKSDEFPDEIYRKAYTLYLIDPERFKIKRENRTTVAAWIDKLDITEDDRSRLHRDNLSEDVEYELIPSPDAED